MVELNHRLMSSRQLVHHSKLSGRSESLIWCLNNFTSDFLSEHIYLENKQVHSRYKRLLQHFPFQLKSWIDSKPLISSNLLSMPALLSSSSSALSHSISSSSSALYIQAPPHNNQYKQFIPVINTSFQKAFYVTKSYSSLTTPKSPFDTSLAQISRILKLKKLKSTDVKDFFNALDKIISLSSTEGISPKFLEIRKDVYKKLISLTAPERFEYILKIFNLIPTQKIARYDFGANIVATSRLDFKNIENVLFESMKYLSNSSVLDLLYSSVTLIFGLAKKDGDLYSTTQKCLVIFYSIILKQLGTLRLLDYSLYESERDILSYIMDQSNSDIIVQILGKMMDHNPRFSQMLATTILDLYYKKRQYEDVVKIWTLKEKQGFASPFDLLRVMKSYSELQLPELAIQAYEKHTDIQAYWHFDVLLRSYAQNQDWVGMRHTFDSLFGRGDLPNIEHYRIVMESIAKIADIDTIQFLYQNLTARHMEPNVHIFNAIMYAQYAYGNVTGVREAFEALEAAGIKPNSRTFDILLMVYRDARDVESAISVMRMMYERSLPIHRSYITTLLSLCARRKDDVQADLIFGWFKQLGIEPDLIAYNALLYCYTQAYKPIKVRDLCEEMREKKLEFGIDTLTVLLEHYSGLKRENSVRSILDQIVKRGMRPDYKFYAVLLDHFSKNHEMEKAESVINYLKAETKGPTVFHYTILMKGYLYDNNYEKVIEIYNSLEDNGIKPTYHMMAVITTAMRGMGIESGRLDLTQESLNLVNNLLENPDTFDITSNHIPRNIPPPDVATALIQDSLGDPSKESVESIIQRMRDPNIMMNNLYSLRNILLDFGYRNEWDKFDQYWDLFMELQRKQYVKRRSKGSDEYVDKIPKADRMINDEIFRLKIRYLSIYNSFDIIIPFVREMEEEGYKMSNELLNDVVQLLLPYEETVESAYEFVEARLMKYQYKRLLLNQMYERNQISEEQVIKELGSYRISQETINALKEAFPNLLKIISVQENISLNKALLRAYMRMPETIKYVYRLEYNSRFNSGVIEKLMTESL